MKCARRVCSEDFSCTHFPRYLWKRVCPPVAFPVVTLALTLLLQGFAFYPSSLTFPFRATSMCAITPVPSQGERQLGEEEAVVICEEEVGDNRRYCSDAYTVSRIPVHLVQVMAGRQQVRERHKERQEG
mmetsp:Transcript_16137/g.40812  ORF Transcript_16137/g.40812 Transcript_16137/m.40812 type:complete len:129 (-) Transcript_16137:756-1142(-)